MSDTSLIDHLKGNLNLIRSERDYFEMECSKLRAALEFYADTKNWDVENGTCHDMVPKGLENPRKLWKVLDMGERARKALNEE